jgi:hypothetical protein
MYPRSNKPSSIEFTRKQVYISFGDTCQDVLCAIGPPCSISKKQPSKFQIHNQHKVKKGYFWNYFDLGIDVMFGDNNEVGKFILHNNPLCHYDLMVYSKCNYEFSIN